MSLYQSATAIRTNERVKLSVIDTQYGFVYLFKRRKDSQISILTQSPQYAIALGDNLWGIIEDTKTQEVPLLTSEDIHLFINKIAQHILYKVFSYKKQISLQNIRNSYDYIRRSCFAPFLISKDQKEILLNQIMQKVIACFIVEFQFAFSQLNQNLHKQPYKRQLFHFLRIVAKFNYPLFDEYLLHLLSLLSPCKYVLKLSSFQKSVQLHTQYPLLL